MFSDEDIKPVPESLLRPGDEIISIREVCLSDRLGKRDLGFHGEPLLSTSNKNDLDVSRPLFRDSFFSDGLEAQQARFAWTEEDGNIAALVSEPGFGTTGQTTFGKDLDAAFKSELKKADSTSSVLQPTNRYDIVFTRKPFSESQLDSSTPTVSYDRTKRTTGARKVDKADPRSRVHYVKYLKRHGRTVKLWECGICSRDFQHQYTLMRHLPTHTDERNFHCLVCGKSFRQLSTLSQHRAIHSTERPHACEVCNKTFNRVSTLISHRRTHSDEKPYRCHLCPKGFHQKGFQETNVHQSEHCQICREIPLYCNVYCDEHNQIRVHIQTGNLRNHLFTHTNERPYRCNICLKGFNQQSNLVCHKNKAHSEKNNTNNITNRNTIRLNRSAIETQPDSCSNSADHCEVSSSVGPCISPMGRLPDLRFKSLHRNTPKMFNEQSDAWNDGPWEAVSGGVIVDPINTYHMSVALATKQTPFALLKPDNGAPVLVKVVDTKIPGGKQMLVPATAEDLKIGGKIVMKDQDQDNDSEDIDVESTSTIDQAVQIRVPVVATVVPKIKPGGGLHLSVEEPHHAYHTTVSAEDPCSSKDGHHPGPSTILPPLQPRPLQVHIDYGDSVTKTETASNCSLLPPAPSPPFDLISMDLFEPMECIPLGPQIIAVDNIQQPPHSDDSDIFIGEFEESIPLTDSD